MVPPASKRAHRAGSCLRAPRAGAATSQVLPAYFVRLRRARTAAWPVGRPLPHPAGPSWPRGPRPGWSAAGSIRSLRFLLLVSRMPLLLAARHRPGRPAYLGTLPHPGLGEYCEGDDPSPRCDPVGNAGALTAAEEAQFPELARKLTCVRPAEQHAPFLQISPGRIRLAPTCGRPGLLASRLPPVPVRPVPRSYHQRYLLARWPSIVEPGLGAADCPCRSASSADPTIWPSAVRSDSRTDAARTRWCPGPSLVDVGSRS